MAIINLDSMPSDTGGLNELSERWLSNITDQSQYNFNNIQLRTGDIKLPANPSVTSVVLDFTDIEANVAEDLTNYLLQTNIQAITPTTIAISTVVPSINGVPPEGTLRFTINFTGATSAGTDIGICYKLEKT